MRTPLKALVLALAVVFTVSAGTLAAAAVTDWTSITVKQVPMKVKTSYEKLFAHSRIMKAEKSGSGPTAIYRLTIKRKGKPEAVTFDAQGRTQG